jgi:hypothetical protein
VGGRSNASVTHSIGKAARLLVVVVRGNILELGRICVLWYCVKVRCDDAERGLRAVNGRRGNMCSRGLVQRLKPEAACAMSVEGRSHLQRLPLCNGWE